MSQNRVYTLGRKQNWMIPALYMCLSLIGVMAVYSSLVSRETIQNAEVFPPGFLTYGVQIGIGVFLFFLVSVISDKFWHMIHVPANVVGIVLLILVLLIGHEVNGARSWFRLPGGISFQVAELAKFTTALSLSALLSYYKTDLTIVKHQLLAAALIMIPTALILLQPDAGTAIVIISLFLVLYLGGFPGVIFFFAFASLGLFIISEVWSVVSAFLTLFFLANLAWIDWKIKNLQSLVIPVVLVMSTIIFSIFSGLEEALLVNGVFFLYFVIREIFQKNYGRVIQSVVAISAFSVVIFLLDFFVNHVLKSHQRERIDVWLNPENCSPQGSLYNLLQSKMAISSGGFSGKGFLEGTMTRLDYVPEQSTDFIFSVIGEEQGFLGCFAVIVLFAILIYRLTAVAQQVKSPFNRYFSLCVACFLVVHVFINIGMTMGVMPVVGIPLPLVSKGGTAFIMFSIMLGIVHSFQYQRNA